MRPSSRPCASPGRLASARASQAPALRRGVGVGPIVSVHEVEVGVAGVIRDRAPAARVLHAVNDRAVAAGRLAETAAMRTAGQGAELPVDEGNDLTGEVVRVTADRRRVHVLVAAQGSETVGKDEDRRPHLALVDETRRALREIVAERFPVGVRESRTGEAGQIVEHGEAPFAPGSVILGGQPDADPAHVRVAERVVTQDLGDVLQHDQGAGGTFGTLERHG
jgi:hypothetical protein